MQCQHDLVPDCDRIRAAVLPWYFYLRFFVASILLILSSILLLRWHYQDLRQQQAWLNAPRLNDIYYVDHEKLRETKGDIYRYGLAKVVALESKVSLVYGRHRYLRQRQINITAIGGTVFLPQKSEVRVKSRRPGDQENRQAIMYYQGLRVELDKVEAARLFEVAAKKGHAFAQ